MAYQVILKVDRSSHIQAESGKLVKGKWSPKKAKEPETVPTFIVGSPIATQS